MSRADAILERLDGVRQSGSGWTARCPAHDDRHASLSLREGDDGRVLLKCHRGCETEAVVQALGLEMRGLFPDGGGEGGLLPSVKARTPEQSPLGLTLEALAQAKKLPDSYLRELGITQIWHPAVQGPAVRVPYTDTEHQNTAVRFRLSLDGPQRFLWRRGDRPCLYGSDRLEEARTVGWLLLVEGESDAWTAWHHGLPALGIPGKSTWRAEWASLLGGLEVYLWREPDASDLVERVTRTLPGLLVVQPPDGLKDLSEAHLRGENVPQLIEKLRAQAVPASELIAEAESERLRGLAQQAAPLLEADDPVSVVKEALRARGYGGDLMPALVVYFVVTSRLLAMRLGAMLAHLLLFGPPSAGKSYALQCVLQLLPPEGYHVIEAGSPRVLIYDTADLRHRAVIFGEADSLPSGEDNPAASAVRNLLQDGHLHYRVTVRDPESGQFVVQEVNKPGPTVLLTTAVRRLGEQLGSRLFVLDVPDDPAHVREALATQAGLELDGARPPDEALIAFQAYLQARAPWDVVVPFARELAEAIGHPAVAPRATRDFARLLALVKSVAVLRHRNRRTDPNGRLVAEVEDYATVFGLVGQLYRTSATGCSEGVRATVRLVGELRDRGESPVTVALVASELGIAKSSASGRVHTALEYGWLLNDEVRKGRPFNLRVGDPLPDEIGLPRPDELDRSGVRPVTDGYSSPPPLLDLEAAERACPDCWRPREGGGPCRFCQDSEELVRWAKDEPGFPIAPIEAESRDPIAPIQSSQSKMKASEIPIQSDWVPF